ncbi:hypothetical protein E3U43_010492 [Larimichthys crocea]|uniref:Uncharacterized protein n=1 Tax=Larimichthys crocea TaxID=215358 RepID=A0ACD3RGT3_LARCR|nr:hypothetical protein E3U43_010492 [Larimichthys crocea]
MEDTQKGQQPDSVPEMGEDAVTSVNPSPPVQSLSEEERQELQEELFKTKMSPPASSTNPDNQDAANPSTDTLSSQPEDLPTQEMPMN